MGNIVIKKKISLEFLGEEYKDAYLTFSSIPVSEHAKIADKIKSIGEDNDKALEMLTELVAGRFIEGKFPNSEGNLEDVSKEQLTQFPIEVYSEVMGQLQGKVSPN